MISIDPIVGLLLATVAAGALAVASSADNGQLLVADGELHVTKGGLEVLGPRRSALHDYVLEPSGDQTRLESHLRFGRRRSDRWSVERAT